jgi:hypothetical protein
MSVITIPMNGWADGGNKSIKKNVSSGKVQRPSATCRKGNLQSYVGARLDNLPGIFTKFEGRMIDDYHTFVTFKVCDSYVTFLAKVDNKVEIIKDFFLWSKFKYDEGIVIGCHQISKDNLPAGIGLVKLSASGDNPDIYPVKQAWIANLEKGKIEKGDPKQIKCYNESSGV